MTLAPSARGRRMRGPRGQRVWMDGPFAESKELISGFAILELPSVKEVVAWTERYADILGECEVDVRELAS